jgi:hypothetical protein
MSSEDSLLESVDSALSAGSNLSVDSALSAGSNLSVDSALSAGSNLSVGSSLLNPVDKKELEEYAAAYSDEQKQKLDDDESSQDLLAPNTNLENANSDEPEPDPNANLDEPVSETPETNFVSGGNEVYGGESEYAINNILIQFDIINKEFISVRDPSQEGYGELRAKYVDKLRELFALNAKDVKEFDSELQELYVLDDFSLAHVLFKRFNIKQELINRIVNELNLKLNSKYFNNKIKLDKEYPLQQFSRLFKNIPKEKIILPKFDEPKKIDINCTNTIKHLDTSCKTCIFNRVFFICSYLNDKIISLKQHFIEMEKNVLSIVTYLDSLHI